MRVGRNAEHERVRGQNLGFNWKRKRNLAEIGAEFWNKPEVSFNAKQLKLSF